MVSKESVEGQLVKIGFNMRGLVNKAEVRELPSIILPDEEIYECVNGYYEGGLSLLVATNIRVLLVDKKPFNYLTVEDLRFDMINQIDYSHRMMGAQISISTGNKNLRFRSYNQPRLRKLINHVQHCMAEIKNKQSQHQEGQNQHLEQINQQLQAYLLAQYQSQLEFNQRLHEAQTNGAGVPQPPVIKPTPELADYLYSQSLLRQHVAAGGTAPAAGQQPPVPPATPVPAEPQAAAPQAATTRASGPQPADAQMAELYAEGWREIFGRLSKHATLPPADTPVAVPQPPVDNGGGVAPSIQQQAPGLEVNALSIAYSKLPMALRNRKFGRPSFHAHSHAANGVPPAASAPAPTA